MAPFRPVIRRHPTGRREGEPDGPETSHRDGRPEKPEAGSRTADAAPAGTSRARRPATETLRHADETLRHADETLRGADETLRGADELAALEARRRHRSGIRPEVEPDGRVDWVLAPGERLLAIRRHALLDRRQSPRPGPPGLPGDVYVTSTRILHLNGSVLAYELDDIVETGVAGRRLLLLLAGGRSVSLLVDRPRLLRVDIAAARTERRRCLARREAGGEG